MQILYPRLSSHYLLFILFENSDFLYYCWHACFAAAQPNAAHLPSDRPVA
jgi:hypothetical protein